MQSEKATWRILKKHDKYYIQRRKWWGWGFVKKDIKLFMKNDRVLLTMEEMIDIDRESMESFCQEYFRFLLDLGKKYNASILGASTSVKDLNEIRK